MLIIINDSSINNEYNRAFVLIFKKLDVFLTSVCCCDTKGGPMYCSLGTPRMESWQVIILKTDL